MRHVPDLTVPVTVASLVVGSTGFQKLFLKGQLFRQHLISWMVSFSTSATQDTYHSLLCIPNCTTRASLRRTRKLFAGVCAVLEKEGCEGHRISPFAFASRKLEAAF